MQSHHHIEHDAAGDAGLSYTEAFPALPDKIAPIHPVASSAWPGRTQSQPASRMAVASSVYSETVVIPYEERALKSSTRGTETEKSVCQDIRKEVNGAQITITDSKDGTLTLLISGRRDDVKKARNMALQRLQTQGNIALSIPKEYHRFILGAKGRTKEEIETSTATKIIVPKMDDASDAVRIVGPSEGIAAARERITQIYEEQSKRGSERMEVPKKYHPFIRGPHDRNMERLKSTYGVQVNVPPPSVQRDEISFSGEKNAVLAVKNELLKILNDAQRTKELAVEVPRSQHRYIQGRGNNNIHDIFEKTGVWVELPPQESDSNQVILRGETQALGNALNMVWAKANSVVLVELKAPSFIHKHMIGRGGEKVKDLAARYPDAHVSFVTEENRITIEGPPAEVDAVRKELDADAKQLISTMAVQEITVNEKYMKHLIGKSGTNVLRLKNDLGVQIKANDASSAKPNLIVVEGPKEGVAEAIKQLKERVAKMENERSKDIIIDRKLHKLIIGQKGGKIREIRELFKETNVLFPDAEENSDVVTISGPKEEVEKCYKHLEKMVKDLVLSNYSIEVPIFKDIHRMIIGKGGATIKKIREETETKIDLPEQDSDSDVIVITGKKENVEKAKKAIEKIQNELANAIELKLSVPNKLHNHIIGAKGQQIQAVIQECGNVQITFPPSGSNSDEITIRGPKDDAEKAHSLLQKLAHDKELSSYTVEVTAKPDYHKYIRQAANKLRDRFNVRIMLPNSAQENKEIISIIGKKEDVDKAHAEIEKIIKELQNTVDDTVTIPQKYHKRFTARRAEVINDIQQKAGSVQITFPRDESETVMLRGPREPVNEAKRLLLQKVDDWECSVTIEVDIPPKAYGQVMGRGGCNLNQIISECDVQIKFPERQRNVNGSRGGPNAQQNGSVSPAENGQPEGENGQPTERPQGVTVTGRPENCEMAKDALLALVPIEDAINVPIEFHRGLVSNKGELLDKIYKEFEVSVNVPSPDKGTDAVRLYGLREKVERAKEEINKIVEDLKLRNFKLDMRVDPRFHSALIGPRGSNVNKLRDRFKVNFDFPRRPPAQQQNGVEKTEEELAAEQADRDLIIITGYEADVMKARDHIQAFIDDLNSKVELEVRLDSRIHARIIGGKGLGLKKLCDKFKVDIRFPRRSDPNDDPDTVVVVGDEENVYEAETELKRLEDLYLEDVVENQALRAYHNPRPVQNQASHQNGKSGGFIVRGAPWEQSMPQTGNMEEFPNLAGMTNGNGQPIAAANSRWGAPR